MKKLWIFGLFMLGVFTLQGCAILDDFGLNDQDLEAEIVLKTLTLEGNKEGVVFSPSPQSDHLAGSDVLVSVEFDETVEFIEWRKGDTVVSTDASFTYTVDDDVTLFAYFTPVEQEDSNEEDNNAGDDSENDDVDPPVYEPYEHEDKTYLEGFETLGFEGSSYASGRFIGDGGIEWLYSNALDGPVIDGDVSLRLAGSRNSYLEAYIPGGIQNFSFEYAKPFTGDAGVEVYINDRLIGSDILTESDVVKTFRVDDLDIYGTFHLTIVPTHAQITLDNITWQNNDPEGALFSLTLDSNLDSAVLSPSEFSEYDFNRYMEVETNDASQRFTFLHWEDQNNEVVSEDKSFTVLMNQDHHYTAIYDLKGADYPNNSERVTVTLSDDIQYYYSVGDEWVPAGCTAYDSELDESVPCDVSGTVSTSQTGAYRLTYYAEDEDGNTASKQVIKYVFRDATLLEYDYDYFMDGIYSDVQGLFGEALLEALREIITEDMTLQTYDSARQILEIADRDPLNQENVLLIYNRDSVHGVWDSTTWHREHVWPNSRLGISRVGGSQRNIGSDLHNLRAINPGVNSSRSNKVFDWTTTSDTFYPGEDRGDVARIYFYMVTAWDHLSLSDELIDPTTTYELEGAIHGFESVLIDFHYDDAVDDFERQRNDVIYDYQQNRNPFIDYPHLVELIWFDHPEIPLD